jgi:uncharacterized protein YcbX
MASGTEKAVNSAKVEGIFRYPVKGLSPERVAKARLAPGQTIAGDRIYAIENGPSGFDPAAPTYFPKNRFLMLMRNERLANLDTRYDDATQVLTINEGGREVARGDLSTPSGRQAIEDFFAAYCAGELRGPPRILHGAGHSFSDVARKVVSVINLASVAQIETLLGAAVNPLRFRGNVYVTGWPAWREFDLVGEEIGIGPRARLKIVKRIARCAATNVDPDTGIRDLDIPAALLRSYDHTDCGIYGEVIAAGDIAPGDAVQ